MTDTSQVGTSNGFRAVTKIQGILQVRLMSNYRAKPNEGQRDAMKTRSVRLKSATLTKARQPKTQLLRIEWAYPTAFNVSIATAFNDWYPSATDMVALGTGRRVKELTLPPGIYENRLVMGGAWMVDLPVQENADGRLGGVNSILPHLAQDAVKRHARCWSRASTSMTSPMARLLPMKPELAC